MSGPGFTLTKLFEDNFTRPDESPLSDGGNWNLVAGSDTLEVSSNVCQGSVLLSANGCTENYAGALPNDQYAQITIGAPGADGSIAGVVVRADANQQNALFVLFYGTSSQATVEEWAGDTQINSTSVSVSFTTGDVLALVALGVTWYVLKNGQLVQSGPIIQAASGQSAVWLTPITSLSAITVTDFQTGSVATPTIDAQTQFLNKFPRFRPEVISIALLDLLKTAEYNFVTATRTITVPQNIDAAQQPYLGLLEWGARQMIDTDRAQNLEKWVIEYSVFIFIRLDTVENAARATLMNNALWAIVSVMRATPIGEKQTLNGLVDNAKIVGDCTLLGGIVGGDQQLVLHIPIRVDVGL